jgi:hypothetical protein
MSVTSGPAAVVRKTNQVLLNVLGTYLAVPNVECASHGRFRSMNDPHANPTSLKQITASSCLPKEPPTYTESVKNPSHTDCPGRHLADADRQICTPSRDGSRWRVRLDCHTPTTMIRPRCLLVLLVLAALSNACSSGAGRTSTTNTTASPHPEPTATRVATPSSLVTIGPCPVAAPNDFSSKRNAGVARIGAVLVPMAATSARVCRYALTDESLEASVLVPTIAAERLETQTNALALLPASGSPHQCFTGQEWFVRFGNASAHVDVLAENGVQDNCADATNGVRFVQATGAWFSTLMRLADLPTSHATGVNP